MPFILETLLAMSPVVSPLTRPLAVNPFIVFVKPSNSVEPDKPVTVALALLTNKVPFKYEML